MQSFPGIYFHIGCRGYQQLGGRGEGHRNDFFPITFIGHNQKSNGGRGNGVNGGGGGGGGGMVPHSYATGLMRCCPEFDSH